MVFMEMKP